MVYNKASHAKHHIQLQSIIDSIVYRWHFYSSLSIVAISSPRQTADSSPINPGNTRHLTPGAPTAAPNAAPTGDLVEEVDEEEDEEEIAPEGKRKRLPLIEFSPVKPLWVFIYCVLSRTFMNQTININVKMVLCCL